MSTPPEFPSSIKINTKRICSRSDLCAFKIFPGNSSPDEIHLAAARGSAQLLDFTQFEMLDLQPRIINRFRQIDCIHNLKF